MAFVRNGVIVDNFRELTHRETTRKGKWTKIYYKKIAGWATSSRFEELGQSIGKLLDETQLQRATDWSYVKIEIIQHNDRIIATTVKCAEHA